MIRAVIDTNILLSALRSRNGASHQILCRLVKREFELVIGNTVLAEYDEVLKRECPGFGIPVATVDRFLDALCAAASYFSTLVLLETRSARSRRRSLRPACVGGESRLSDHL